MNNFRTVILLAAISGLLILVGAAIGGIGGIFLFGLIALGMNFGSYWFSANIVLRSSHAKEIGRDEDPRLFAMIEEVAERSDMPMPRVYVMDTPQPNAFATGRNPKHAAVAVTTGIRQMLTDSELRGVIGHEMAHVKNRDILTSSIVATIASAISMIAFMSFFFGGRRGVLSMLITALIAPIAAGIIQAAISRSREFQADLDGARVIGDPEALASALAKIEAGVQHAPRAVPEATAHLYIANPFGGASHQRFFSTHPPTEERIRRLQNMG